MPDAEKHSDLVRPYDATRTGAPVSRAPDGRYEPYDFFTTAKLVVQHRGVLTAIPDDAKVEIGLLLAAPSPEGSRVVEPAPETGYTRQPATFDRSRPKAALANVEEITFTFKEGQRPKPTICGVFVNDRMFFYGGLRPQAVQKPTGGDDVIRLGVESISLSFTGA